MILRNSKRSKMGSDDGINNIIYSNSISYRIHVDKLRWSLWAGYIAFFGALNSFLNANQGMTNQEIGHIYFLALILSFFYFIILILQSWVYNSYNLYCEECENRFISGSRIRSRKKFLKENGKNISPLHHSYFFALLVVLFSTIYFFHTAIKFLYPCYWMDFNGFWRSLLVIGMYLFFILSMIEIFRKWDRMIYKAIFIILLYFSDNHEKD